MIGLESGKNDSGFNSKPILENIVKKEVFHVSEKTVIVMAVMI